MLDGKPCVSCVMHRARIGETTAGMKEEFMRNEFLAVDKAYLGRGLKSIDILVMAQIEEFQRNGRRCYMTTEQLSVLFGESERTVERCLERLDKAKRITRKTDFVSGNGRGNRQRILSLPTDANKTETLKNGVSSRQINSMEAPEIIDGSAKNNPWKRHNGGIKEKEKEEEKRKENLQYNVENILLEFFGPDEDIGVEENRREPVPEPQYIEPLYELSGGRSNRKRRRSLAELEDEI